MKDSYVKSKIISNEEIAPHIYRVKLEGRFKGNPGQFFMLRGWDSLDPFLPRPISIHSKTDEDISFLYEEKGRGTHLISQLKEGDYLNLLGPLGNGFDLTEIGKFENIALIAGGIGIAPLLYLGEKLNKDIDLYAGFRDKAFALDDFRPYTNNINISTESGIEGHKGFITDLIDKNYDLIISCGPEVMMKAVSDKVGKDKLIVSMENRMACGIGACMGCTIRTKNGMKRVCKEGPVFYAEEVFLND